jgi:hypothetical protein
VRRVSACAEFVGISHVIDFRLEAVRKKKIGRTPDPKSLEMAQARRFTS